MRLDETASGVFVITPTPFTEDGALDEASTDRMIEAYLAAGASGLTVLGIQLRWWWASPPPASPACGRWPGPPWAPAPPG